MIRSFLTTAMAAPGIFHAFIVPTITLSIAFGSRPLGWASAVKVRKNGKKRESERIGRDCRSGFRDVSSWDAHSLSPESGSYRGAPGRRRHAGRRVLDQE